MRNVCRAICYNDPARQKHILPELGRAQQTRGHQSGQVAQLVERSPEKAGVGGSIPSLATINSTLR